jgi:amidophosphoribosyltransferase
MRSKKEFIARDKQGNLRKIDDIAKEIGADSLGYLSLEGLKQAIGFKTCRGCIDFPDGYPPKMQQDVQTLYKHDKMGSRAYECI